MSISIATISKEWPPNIEQIEKYDPVFRSRSNVVCTYGDTIYNPHGVELTQDVLVHEHVHVDQQLEYPGGPAAYTERCFTDKQFFLEREVEAYQAQAHYMVKMGEPNVWVRLAGRLASPMYNFGISNAEAMRLLAGVSRSTPEQSPLPNSKTLMDDSLNAAPTGVPATEATPAAAPAEEVAAPAETATPDAVEPALDHEDVDEHQ